MQSNAIANSDSNAWVMTTKQVGDQVAGWVIDELFPDHKRLLRQSERCELTSFCYPTGARMVRARLRKVEESRNVEGLRQAEELRQAS